MKKQPLRIAFYGKGGIGKTTIASNISALFAKCGKTVLHIGCDPKADSTRLLLQRRIPSVLQQLEQKNRLSREDMLFTGAYGVQCVEAGGPEAGSGCAGLGITTAVEELKEAGIFEENWDVIVYDVLGDVVCGGFSVPMRRHYTDQVYVVTSTNYMSLYAANNILKGIVRYSDKETPLFGGFLFNHIREELDKKIASMFAEETKADILLSMAEDSRIACADFQGKLFTEAFPESKSTRSLLQTIEDIQSNKTHRLPAPMNAEEMETFGNRIAEEWYGTDNNRNGL